MSPKRPRLKAFPIFLAAALLAAQVAGAGPLALILPAPSVEIGSRVANPASFRLATGPFAAGAVPADTVTGGLEQHAFRLDTLKLNTLQVMQALRGQLTDAGYAVAYECDTAACGGFDFRFALDVLPEPQMHVDLGDFRYLAAKRAGGAVVAVLVSRSADQGFVQVTTIAPSGDAAAPALAASVAAAQAAPDPAPTAVPPVADPVADPVANRVANPVANRVADRVADPSGSLGDSLVAHGSVALEDLIFPSGASGLEAKDYTTLADLAAWLAANPARKVVLVGHTDASGGLAGNIALSKQRAQSVRSWLIQHYGATAGQIDAQGAGYLAPRDTNLTDAGRTRNRRVEVVLTSTP